MSHPLDSAPAAALLMAADRLDDEANEAVKAYVAKAFNGCPTTYSYVFRSRIELVGFGKVWRNDKGHRVHKRVYCGYGDWQRLDALIAEAKAHYDSMR